MKIHYLCVHCGTRNVALFRVFTESALTLQTCVWIYNLWSVCKSNTSFLLQVHCKQIIDKYVEYDFTTIFIDLLLLRISAYRHVLCNTASKVTDKLLLLWVKWV